MVSGQKQLCVHILSANAALAHARTGSSTVTLATALVFRGKFYWHTSSKSAQPTKEWQRHVCTGHLPMHVTLLPGILQG
jgi:ABC-type xylose transport system permease subunit